MKLIDGYRAGRHKLWVEIKHNGFIPSRTGRDLFPVHFCYPYLIPDGIGTNRVGGLPI